MEKHKNGFPVTHVLGFIMSLVLTFGALGVALKTSLPFTTIIWIIGSLAIIQAALQLYMFMHMNEGEDGTANTINVISGFLVAVVAVAGSIWVMSFGM
ncbi:cytochrome aa3 quinol oxidase subunit IV [Neobacillus dielmonensis]|uniref:cytochrome aa3 quinol oxidase subunit IV n=1 Tax=Neobacillus dielmonensis TaxID=1347369 RepID=UPI0005AAA3C2|nr:cytochrome aa3 quinol oxidase subunit IV [Neobacillus dielmonensis]